MARISAVVVPIFSILLFGCGGGGEDSKGGIETPELSITLTGTAFGSGSFGSGVVSAYLLTGGVKGRLLASTNLNSSGTYTLAVPTYNPVIVEATAGCYTENASLKSSRLPQTASVCMSATESIRAVFIPTTVTHTVNITPYTEAATGLAMYLATHGDTDSTAVTLANQTLSDLVGVSITDTVPATLDASAIFDGSHLYGALLGGMASWINSASSPASGQFFGVFPFTTVRFAYLMGDDLKADGLLNGIGTQAPPAIGNTILDGSIYRHGIAVFAALHARYRGSFSQLAEFAPAFQHYNDSKESILGSGSLIPLDEGGPTFHNSTLGLTATANGNLNISLYIDDIVGIRSGGVLVYIDESVYDAMLFDGQFLGQATGFINTTVFPNGNHKITIRATNFLGNTTEQSAIVNFQN